MLFLAKIRSVLTSVELFFSAKGAFLTQIGPMHALICGEVRRHDVWAKDFSLLTRYLSVSTSCLAIFDTSTFRLAAACLPREGKGENLQNSEI
jgi:hypothetical protein